MRREAFRERSFAFVDAMAAPREGCRFRTWVCTVNGSAEVEDQAIINAATIALSEEGLWAHLGERATWLCGQLERGEEEGRLHLQFGVRFKSAIALGGCKSRLDGYFLQFYDSGNRVFSVGHYEVARGKPDEIEKYCTKEDTRVLPPVTFGEKPAQGKAKGAMALLTAILQSSSEEIASMSEQSVVSDMLEQHGMETGLSVVDVMAKRPDYLTNALRLLGKTAQRTEWRGVHWIWGEPGIGKSYSVRTRLDQSGERYLWITAGNLAQLTQDREATHVWFPPSMLSNESTLVLDDVLPGLSAQMARLLFDREACSVAVKGGSRPASWTRVIVLSNHSPETAWANPADTLVQAARSRITRVIRILDTEDRRQRAPQITADTAESALDVVWNG